MERLNKPKKKSTMIDFIKENQTTTPLQKQESVAQAHIHAFKYTDEYAEQVASYNTNLLELDPLYTQIKPLHEILVRFYLYEPQKVGSLVLPFKQMVPIQTNSGVGKYTEVESDFPFQLKAVVISAPESNPLKAGDIIFCSRRAVQMNAIGTGANTKIVVDQGFVHPNTGLFDLPTDVTSQHYGYALIQYHEIKGKL